MFKKLTLFRKSQSFYDLFEKGGNNLLEASEKLVELFDDFTSPREKAAEIKRLEHKGDDITHQIIGNLHRSFVTPIDREDIAALTNRLDDMLDYMEGAVKYMFLNRIEQPTPRSIEISYIIRRLAAELNKAIPLLRYQSRLKDILPYCVEIHRLENEADDLRHAALADLFDEETDVREILKWRDIYNHLEKAVDRGEDAANVLEGIVLKYA